MNEPSTDDRLIEQLAAALREPPDDELARGLQAPIDPVLRERLFEMMEENRVSATTPVVAANGPGRRWAIPGGIAIAAAAVILILIGVPPLGLDEAPQIAVVPRAVPEYRFETDGGRVTERSHTKPSDGKPQYTSNLEFTWILEPTDKPVDWTVGVRMCAKSASGEEVDIDVDPFLEVAKTGVIRLKGRVLALGLSPGDWTIKVAVGDPAVLAEVDSICSATTTAGIDVRERDIELLAD